MSTFISVPCQRSPKCEFSYLEDPNSSFLLFGPLIKKSKQRIGWRTDALSIGFFIQILVRYGSTCFIVAVNFFSKSLPLSSIDCVNVTLNRWPMLGAMRVGGGGHGCDDDFSSLFSYCSFILRRNPRTGVDYANESATYCLPVSCSEQEKKKFAPIRGRAP